MPRYPSHDELVAMYEARDAALRKLASQDLVQAADLGGLDHLGRFRVADELWEKCSQSTRHALLHDEHHYVRSAATLQVAPF